MSNTLIDVEWYVEYLVHPSQDKWISTQTHSATDAHELVRHVQRTGNVVAIRIVRKDVIEVAREGLQEALG